MKNEDVGHVIEITSDTERSCRVCGRSTTDGGLDEPLAATINHYLKHGYQLVHIGQETTADGDLRTVALVGKPK